LQGAFERGNQVGGGAGFADKALRAQKTYRGFRFGCAILHTQKNDFGCGGNLPDFECGLDAIHAGHVEVEEDQFRLKRFYAVDGLGAVLGFAADEKGIGVQEGADAFACAVVIVNQKDSARDAPPRGGSLEGP
jgi:hypothetical protein